MNKSTREIDVVELSVDELTSLLKLTDSDWHKNGICDMFTTSAGHKIKLLDEDFYRQVVISGID